MWHWAWIPRLSCCRARSNSRISCAQEAKMPLVYAFSPLSPMLGHDAYSIVIGL